MIDKKELAALCEKHGYPLAAPALESLAAYLEILLKWNKVMNLVGPQSWQQITAGLVMDSFHLAGFLNALPLPQDPVCWDFGAGAGLPGIPLRMVWPQGEYIMVEAREKRALFLQGALAACKLAGTKVIRGRVEQFMAQTPKRADLMISRAFMPWRKVLELVTGKLVPGAHVVCLTLEPEPEGIPAAWQVAATRRYEPTPGVTHYFWAFREK